MSGPLSSPRPLFEVKIGVARLATPILTSNRGLIEISWDQGRKKVRLGIIALGRPLGA
jgi:hypothetical protein